MANYQFGVYGGGTGNSKENPACNACVFATSDEADRAGNELLGRWYAPSGYVVIETTDPVNYEFPKGACRPNSLKG